MKKHIPGFVPINFNQVGKILLLFGLAGILLKTISNFTKWFYTPNIILFMGISFVILSIYIAKVAPKNN